MRPSVSRVIAGLRLLRAVILARGNAAKGEAKFLTYKRKQLENRIRPIFRNQQAYVLDAMRGTFADERNAEVRYSTNATPEDIANGIPLQERLSREIVLEMDDAAKKGIKTRMTALNLGKFGVGYDVVNKKAGEFLGEKLSHELSQSKGTIHDTTVTRINEILKEAYENGWSYQKTAALIQDQGEAGVFSLARAEMIAVREIGVAYEKGNYLPMQEFERVNPDRQAEKFWSTVGDDRVTPEHTQNEEDGWVPLSHVFTGTLDEVAPGSDNPRCRCTMLYRIA